MCGIVGMFEISSDAESFRPQVLKMARKIRHRGPDWSGIYCGDKTILAHERLSIVDPESGGQPLKSKDGKLILAVNGEIYNHRELRKQLAGEYEFLTGSDCEVILALYRKKGINFLEDLNGIFAFALYDSEKDLYLIARDHMGIIPLYMGWDDQNHFYVASELKALEGVCKVIDPFLPGHYLCSTDKKMTRWYTRDWMQYDAVKDNGADIAQLRHGLEDAVRRQLMSDVPYGVLLSGGLDSSIISAIAKKYASKRIETDGRSDAWWPQLHSFAVGLKGAPDLAAARKVAEHIGTVHHEINYTIQEGLDALRDVIYYLETYDVTTVRASTPMYLLARVIKSMGIKMVLSGEGADELFGGYLYFHKAPNAQAFHEETVRKLSKLHLYDCLRANKALAAWGVEGRVPFQRGTHGEMDCPQSFRGSVAGERCMASEGAILGWCRIQLDRHFEKDHLRGGVRRTNESCSGTIPDQSANEQRGVLLPGYFRGAFPVTVSSTHRTIRTVSCMQYS